MPSQSTTDDVDAFMRALDHPLKAEIEAVRAIILGVDQAVAEGIKWNAPSFRCREYFATFHLRPRDRVQLILHLGAKARDTGKAKLGIADPSGLLEWLAKDRATVRFRDANEVAQRQPALEAVLRQWISHAQ